MLGWTVLRCYYESQQLSVHAAEFTQSQHDLLLTFDYVTNSLWQFSLMLVKISICVFHLRFNGVDRRTFNSLIACLSFIILFNIPTGVLVVLIHTQSEDQPTYEAYLRTLTILVYVFGCCNTFSDIWIIVTVSPRALKLRTRRRHKAAILILISMGLAAVAASILHTIRQVGLIKSTDQGQLWTVGEIQIWSSLQANIAIFCASAPALAPLLGKSEPKERSAPHELLTRPSRTKPSRTKPSRPKPSRPKPSRTKPSRTSILPIQEDQEAILPPTTMSSRGWTERTIMGGDMMRYVLEGRDSEESDRILRLSVLKRSKSVQTLKSEHGRKSISRG